MDKEQVFAALEELGIAEVRLHFSGGHDEGGVDHITAFSATGEEIDHEIPDYPRYHYDRDASRAKHNSRLDALSEALQLPIEATYGGFAFEGSVDGVLIWTLEGRSVRMERQEQDWLERDPLVF